MTQVAIKSSLRIRSLLTRMTVVSILGGASPVPFAKAADAPTAKAFAVFVLSYNSDNDQVVGGVAGTAFFVAPGKAITAFHVLNPASFTPSPGFQHRRVYLIHENAPPLELSASEVRHVQDKDQTIIELKAGRAVERRFVFEVATRIAAGAAVETEGFVAQTAGPVLVRDGAHIVIAAVPRLSRFRLRGDILRSANVHLTAADVRLTGADCVQLSYKPIVGFSGGPVILADGRVAGMNSFAEPETRARTWAVKL